MGVFYFDVLNAVIFWGGCKVLTEAAATALYLLNEWLFVITQALLGVFVLKGCAFLRKRNCCLGRSFQRAAIHYKVERQAGLVGS